jgi:hypothetical protein
MLLVAHAAEQKASTYYLRESKVLSATSPRLGQTNKRELHQLMFASIICFPPFELYIHFYFTSPLGIIFQAFLDYFLMMRFILVVTLTLLSLAFAVSNADDDGTCGPRKSCLGSSDGQCCSRYGYW